MSPTIAERMHAGRAAESDLEDGLIERGLDDWSSFGCDDYDNSIEINGAPDDARLTTAARDWLLGECGFTKIYLNHKDGWETHYHPSCPDGWRRRYVKDPTVTTTNVVVGDPDPGYYEISYWPESWDKQQGWLKSGYMRIVPDPLAPHLSSKGNKE